MVRLKKKENNIGKKTSGSKSILRSKSKIRKRRIKRRMKDGKVDVIMKNGSKEYQQKNNKNETSTAASNGSDSNNNVSDSNNSTSNSNLYINIGLIIVAVITILTVATVYTMKNSKTYSTAVNIIHVWAYAWMTAVCTGIGALPFFMIDDVNDFWLGICNAIAGGMMIAASLILIYEGVSDGLVIHDDLSVAKEPGRF